MPFEKTPFENVFYFILKALPFSKCLDILVMWKKWLDKKDQVNFKIYDVTTWLANN